MIFTTVSQKPVAITPGGGDVLGSMITGYHTFAGWEWNPLSVVALWWRKSLGCTRFYRTRDRNRRKQTTPLQQEKEQNSHRSHSTG